MSDKSKPLALLSVSDKTGIVDFANILISSGYEIVSTGGTAKALEKEKIPVTPIEQITGNPEAFDGRMKTISFQIESGILFDRSNKEHKKQAKELGIRPIDIVVCNLYPFEKVTNNHKVSFADAIENIDIGGPTMVRAAAKNHKSCLVVTDPKYYDQVGEAIKRKKVTLSLRQQLAEVAFHHTAFYDSLVAQYLSQKSGNNFPDEISIPGRKISMAKYGENPHQQGAWYITPNCDSALGNLKNLTPDKEPSITNLLDVNSGLETIRLFKEPTAVIIKHNTPCGIAVGKNGAEAFDLAIKADPESAFGGIVIMNRKLNMKAAEVVKTFKKSWGQFDVIVAPSIDPKALEVIRQVRKNTIVFECGEIKYPSNRPNIKFVDGGFIMQTPDINLEEGFKSWKVVTKKKPTKEQLEQMKFAWEAFSRIRSNTILIPHKHKKMTVGIGSGQTSRIRSVRIALEMAKAAGQVEGAVLASDSFFPFPDSVNLAAEYGVSAIVQQGGSINDQASIEAADKAGIAMVMTGRRAFWH